MTPYRRLRALLTRGPIHWMSVSGSRRRATAAAQLIESGGARWTTIDGQRHLTTTRRH